MSLAYEVLRPPLRIGLAIASLYVLFRSTDWVTIKNDTLDLLFNTGKYPLWMLLVSRTCFGKPRAAYGDSDYARSRKSMDRIIRILCWGLGIAFCLYSLT